MFFVKQCGQMFSANRSYLLLSQVMYILCYIFIYRFVGITSIMDTLIFLFFLTRRTDDDRPTIGARTKKKIRVSVVGWMNDECV